MCYCLRINNLRIMYILYWNGLVYQIQDYHKLISTLENNVVVVVVDRPWPKTNKKNINFERGAKGSHNWPWTCVKGDIFDKLEKGGGVDVSVVSWSPPPPPSFATQSGPIFFKFYHSFGDIVAIPSYHYTITTKDKPTPLYIAYT